MRKPGGIGTLLGLAALVIVLLLAAKAWKAALPAASQALRPSANQAVPNHGDKAAGEAVRSGKLPNLKTTGERTDAHVKQVQEAASNQD